MEKKLDLANMKKILIVNSRSSSVKSVGMVMWGAWAVASYLESEIKDSDVKFLDENNEDNFIEKFRNILKNRDTVGFSVCSMQIKYTSPLIRYIKKNYPNIKIIIGGIHPILFPNQDYGELIDVVIDYDLPKHTFNYNLLPEKVKEVYRNKRAQVLTGFNCSYKCTFCVNSVKNCKYEGVPLERICSDIDYVIENFNPPIIYFRDEDFLFDIKKAEGIIDYIIRKKYKFRWEANTRVSHFREGRIDDDLLKKIKISGCTQLRFGAESGSQRVLNFLKKGQTVEKIKFAVKQTLKHKINACCSFLIGIPTETPEEREMTFKLISELHNYDKEFSILGPQMYRPYPGGLLYEEAKKYGLSVPEKFEDWEDYYENNPKGDIFDEKTNYPWLTQNENKILPNTWILAQYGLMYSNSRNPVLKLIGLWLKHCWNNRRFTGIDISILKFARIKIIPFFLR